MKILVCPEYRLGASVPNIVDRKCRFVIPKFRFLSNSLNSLDRQNVYMLKASETPRTIRCNNTAGILRLSFLCYCYCLWLIFGYLALIYRNCCGLRRLANYPNVVTLNRNCAVISMKNIKLDFKVNKYFVITALDEDIFD